VKELDLSLKQAKIEGAVQPHIASSSPLLRGIAPQDVPQLSGYDVTTAKPEAIVGLVSDLGQPLLAHWNYGLGRVVAFTSDAGPHWASHWLSWKDFADFWSQSVRWTMASPINRQLQPSAVVSSQMSVVSSQSTHTQSAHLVVESLNADNS